MMSRIINSFSLKEISAKSSEDGYQIDIPSLQRGLVWKPKQVEFLWDSILRLFPIGGFVLFENNIKSYNLMDGQQRFESIRIGFEYPTIKSTAILWLDVCPGNINGSTRKYFIKATTVSHPWGYKNDDDCSVLSAADRRGALKKYYGDEEKNIYKDEISLLDTYPFMSKLPIPLSFFLNSDISSKEKFTTAIESKIENMTVSWKNEFWNQENKKVLSEFVEKNFNTFESLSDYRVPFSLLRKDSFENDIIENEGQSNLEILFNRLNTGGTRISKSDLSYSAIKAYWGNIKDKNNELAQGLMPPQSLVMLLFRLILTISKRDPNKMEPALSIKRIRELARLENNANIRYTIIDFYEKEAEYTLKNAKTALYEIPSFIQMKIIQDKPEIFLLLLFLSTMKIDLGDLNVSGLTLLLYWFCNDLPNSINIIYSRIKEDENTSTCKEHIQAALIELMSSDKLSIIYSPGEIRSAVLGNNDFVNSFKETLEYQFIQKIFYNKAILLFAQKEFLKEKFSNFNPADTIAWEDHNTPWDYDHILPRSWSYNKGRTESKSIVDFWLNTIGNLAAIPYEINRSKSDKNIYEYYYKYKDQLLFDETFSKFDESITSQKNLEKAKIFRKTVFLRILEIYTKCYNAFSTLIVPLDTERIVKIKQILKSLGNNAKVYYIANGKREYPLEKPIDWYRKWLSTEIEVTQNCMVSFSWGYPTTFEIGLRKHVNVDNRNHDFYTENQRKLNEIANRNGLDVYNNDWWYLCKPLKIEDIKDIPRELMKLYDDCIKEKFL